ncbi:hypothetical protein GGI07_002349 [Coemansia sp. Benny D115]|nr:hypothetical protein GGI07_002349 [Coemansia sp. Benny D115]
MSTYSYSSSAAASSHVHDDSDSVLMPTISKRRVQIPQIPHSNAVSSDTLVGRAQPGNTGGPAGPSRLNPISHSSFDLDSTSELPPSYEIPSASNGGTMELRQAASMPLRTSESTESRKGIRAALASRFTAKKKDLHPSPSVNSKRQQLQLESLMTSTKDSDEQGSAGAPTVRGQPVGHPMAFHHVEHLSPTVIGPKMSLINGPELYKSYTQPAKSSAPQAPEQKSSTFRSFKPSLFSKSSKALPAVPTSSSKNDPMKTMVTFRGKPIGAPAEFQHVEHLSASELSVKHYQLLNQRQHQGEIMSVLAKPTTVSTENEKRPKTAADRAQKTTFRGLPLSGPVTFEHVEHISLKDYKTHVANNPINTQRPATASASTSPSMDNKSPEPPLPTLPSEFAQRPSTQHKQGGGPRLNALTHTSTQPLPPPPPSNVVNTMMQAHKVHALQKLQGEDPGDLEETEENTAVDSSSPEDNSGQDQQASARTYGKIDNASLKAKAGISKARQISSPFNVQHDVHISVEDLNDILQQVPETWKPYISPARSPLAAEHPVDSQDSTSEPSTPIYESMRTERRHSIGEGSLVAQMEHTGITTASDAPGGATSPGTPGWLPKIVSVVSPQELQPAPSGRKQRSVSGQNSATERAVQDSHISSNGDDAQMRTVCVLSPDATKTKPKLVDASAFRLNPLQSSNQQQTMPPQEVPSSPRSLVEPSNPSEPSPEPGRSHSPSEPASGNSDKSVEKTNKRIKRKSRIISMHAMNMATKRFSAAMAAQPKLDAMAEKDEEEDGANAEPSAPAYHGDLVSSNEHVEKPDLAILESSAEAAQAAAKAKAFAAAAAAAAAKSAASGAAMDGLNEEAGGLQSQGSIRDLEKSGGSVSAKSSKKRRENYGELEEYAEGEFGNVYITTRNVAVGKRPKGEYVAVKVVPKTAKTRYRKLRTELKILRRIR